MYRRFVVTVLVSVLTGFSAICFAQNAIPDHTPFDSYVRVTDKLFVYDKSQFVPYSGPDVSHWELKIPHAPDESNHDMDRKRLGIVSLTPTLRVYVDVLWDPMSEYFELRDVKDGKLIYAFQYYGAAYGLLLFSGQGAVYEFRQPEMMCHGSTTNKYLFAKGKLNEVSQPMHYLNDGETTLIVDGQLFSEPKLSSTQVANLPKGTKVTVLSFNHSPRKDPNDSWYLIRTPLGLTGWVPSGLEITTCN